MLKTNNKILKLWIFQHTGMPKHAWPHQPKICLKINLQLSWNSNCLQKIKTIAEGIVEILKICYFGTFEACPGVLGHTHPKYDN